MSADIEDAGVSIWIFILAILLAPIGVVINFVICLLPSKKVENDLQNISQNGE
ncbi:hypothetical protein [Helicobacter sp. 16-1353]|uniref:hypothetical protein n=1 Tax=Helicobacter sp. 16-1353 TaxID=2004996 RepID=UPI0015EF7785|nr:hypothetical protein [Helicobacter sp. 16-1353]